MKRICAVSLCVFLFSSPVFSQTNMGESTFLQNFDNDGSSEFLAWLMTMVMVSNEEREAIEAIKAREAREARETRELRETREMREDREMREAREFKERREAREREIWEANSRSNTQMPPAKQPEPNLVYTHVLPPRTVELPPSQGNNTQQQAVKPAQTDPPVQPPATPPPAAAVQPSPVPIRDADPLPVRPAPVRPEDLKIIPGLPDRNSGKTYRLQVASYSASEASARLAQFLKSAGFDVEQELSSGFFRVLVKGIAAVDVYAASVKLGSLGFRQIWIRE